MNLQKRDAPDAIALPTRDRYDMNKVVEMQLLYESYKELD
jgi:hypothetical protein